MDELEIRWQQVEQWAEVPDHCRGEGARILAAQDRLADGALTTRRLAPGDNGLTPRLPESSLTADDRLALEELRAFRLEHGGMGHIPEAEERIRALRVLGLARLALASAASDAEVATAEDAIYLSRSLRHCGDLVEGMVGLVIAGETARWAADRGVAPTPTLRAFAPAREELLGVMARDAVWTYDAAEESLRLPSDERELRERTWWLSRGAVFAQRELRILKRVLSDRLHTAAAEPTDLAHMERVFSAPLGGAAEGAVARILTVDMGHVAGNAEEQISRYDEFIADENSQAAR